MRTPVILLAALAAPLPVLSQSTIDFETVGADYSWIVFGNLDDSPSLYSVADNPDPGGVNTSSRVGKYVVQNGATVYAGIVTTDPGPITFTEDNTRIEIDVYKPVISAFDLKFENATGSIAVDLKAANTKVNEWETLVFDASVLTGQTVTKLVIIPDFPDARANGSTNYFDNITFLPGAGGGGPAPDRRLLVGGEPLQVRGVCYQPTPIGADASAAAPFGDYYTADYAAIYDRDLANLRAMGANVVRVYGWSTTADHTDFLDKCWNGGVDPIRVLVNRWINPLTNWSSSTAVSAIAAEFTAIDTRLGDHPAVLALILGNEANIQNNNGANPAFWAALNSVAGAVKAQRPARRVSVAITDAVSQVAARDATMTNIDFWSVQVYRGTTFGTFFNEYAAASEKPLVVTEYGIDAYNAGASAPYPDNGAYVADVVGALWGELEASASIAAGGCVFEYCDEWWKQGSPSTHDTGGFTQAAFPDGFANEEWWGLFAVSVTPGGGPNTLAPRASYNALKSLWKPVPLIASQPASQTVGAGGTVTLSVAADGTGPFTYQWRRDGVAIPGATASSYTVPCAQAFLAGTYSVVVTNANGSVTSEAAQLTVDPPAPSDARLLNLSTRGLSLPGDGVLIPGFVITGDGAKKLLIRVVGPRLSDFGVANPLADPRLWLRRRLPGGRFEDVASNDDWGTQTGGTAADIAAAAAQVGAFSLETDTVSAAVLLELPAGSYGVVSGDAGSGTGIAIAEVYDADPAGAAPGAAQLVNLSNRGYVGTGAEVMIPGFVVSDEGSKTFLVRAVGPTLAGFGVGGTLADPKLTIYRRVDGSPPTEEPILSNNDWEDNPDAGRTAQVAVDIGAFALDAGSKDAAFVVTLPPGVYSAVASGAGNGTGIALVEVYVVP